MRISAGVVGILLYSCSRRENFEGPTSRVQMSYGVADSELLTDDAVLRRVQGAWGYKFRTGLDVHKEVNGKP